MDIFIVQQDCRKYCLKHNNYKIFRGFEYFLLLQSALQPLVGFRPAQLSLHSQQDGFTECRCQRHVQPPTWRRF
jgi:hypothetical protein